MGARDVPPILEFDPDRAALIDPYDRPPHPNAPRAAVACHFPEVIEKLSRRGELLDSLPSLGGLWKVEFEGSALAVFYPGQGSSLAAVTLERVLAIGCSAVVACGGAGAVVPELALGHVVVVDAAVRDEGTSYHYLPPEREVVADPKVVSLLRAVAGAAGATYTVGKTWTTDGFFRETPGRIQRRRAEGCVVVEAETAALFAVGQFRNVPIGQYLYVGDDVSGSQHEERGWRNEADVRQSLFELSARAAARMTTGLG